MAASLSMLKNSFQRHNFDITVHAYQEMLNDDISVEMLESAIGYDDPHICEDYEHDERGASCLVLGYNFENTPLHIIVAYHTTRPMVITTYAHPDRNIWEDDLCTRRSNRAT